MNTSQKGLDLIKSFEGLRLSAYRCPADIPTIGYGTTAGVKMGDTITKERAEKLLRDDVKRFEGYVDRLVKVPMTQGQYDALVALIYNIGVGAFERSTLLKRVNAGQHALAAAEFDRWVYAGGKKLNGLIKRRAAERALYESAEM
ncbi:MAG: lysozyme [Gammaproteobacteria bacterium]|uniref:Putative glycoside hydrolase n=1 Tax=viral metagenome TaxID=1070528 RepID=A0A6M3M6I2_9ZZZZ|nr:lysozyme [Gammaproteobacteria bacterium]